MRKDIIIEYKNDRFLTNSESMGIKSENLQGKIIFKPEPFIEGACRMYIEGRGSILMEKEENSYTLDILSSLLTEESLDICFKITEPENEKGTPVFCSKIIHFKVLDTIESDEEIPEQYPTWIETFDSKIAEIQALEEELEEAEESREEAEVERNARVDEAISNIHDMTEAYNENATAKTNAFNSNATQKTNDFNDNYTQKVNEFNTNAAQKVNDFDDNATDKTTDFNENADDRVEELNNIAEGIEDMTTAFQFANFEVDSNMHLKIIQAQKLKNTNFIFNPETGRMGVRIVNE